jgi:hypothetical protein
MKKTLLLMVFAFAFMLSASSAFAEVAELEDTTTEAAVQAQDGAPALAAETIQISNVHVLRHSAERFTVELESSDFCVVFYEQLDASGNSAQGVQPYFAWPDYNAWTCDVIVDSVVTTNILVSVLDGPLEDATIVFSETFAIPAWETPSVVIAEVQPPKIGSDETLTVTAPLVEHTVTFADGQGGIIKTEQVETGQAATAPDNPTREGYIFDGWDRTFKNVMSDLTVVALWWPAAAEPTYEIIRGFGEWNGNESVTAEIDAPFSKFIALEDPPKNQSGEISISSVMYGGTTQNTTVIQLGGDYLKDFTNGDHDIAVEFEDKTVMVPITVNRILDSPQTSNSLFIFLVILLLAFVIVVIFNIYRGVKLMRRSEVS